MQAYDRHAVVSAVARHRAQKARVCRRLSRYGFTLAYNVTERPISRRLSRRIPALGNLLISLTGIDVLPTPNFFERTRGERRENSDEKEYSNLNSFPFFGIMCNSIPAGEQTERRTKKGGGENVKRGLEEEKLQVGLKRKMCEDN